MAKQLARAGLFAVLSYLGQSAFHRAKILGVTRALLGGDTNYNPTGTSVTVIPDTINCEDLHVLNGLIYTACQDRDGTRNTWFPPLTHCSEPEDAKHGNLRVIDPETDTATALKLEGFGNRDFVTHGIDVIPDPDNKSAVFIFAVNHPPSHKPEGPKADSRIEVFHHIVGSSSAQWIRTVVSPVIRTPNDVIATSPTDIYVTNDHYYRDGALRLVELLGTRQTTAWTDIAHADFDLDYTGDVAVNYNIALKGLHNNNGIGHGPDGTVVIADSAGGVTYFATIEDDGTLKLIPGEIQLPGTIDNPFWFADPYPEVGYDASGVLNGGVQQAILMPSKLRKGEPVPSVAYLSRGKPGQPSKSWNTTKLWADDGNGVSAASVAVMIAIDPKKNGGKKQAKLYASSFASKGVGATIVDL